MSLEDAFEGEQDYTRQPYTQTTHQRAPAGRSAASQPGTPPSEPMGSGSKEK